MLSRKTSFETMIYRVTLDNQSVVIKLYVGRHVMADFDKEAENYGKVRELQGILFPCLLGVFKGRAQYGIALGCLVLEDCGIPKNETLCRLPLDSRHRIFEKITIMHDRGFDKHGYDDEEFVFKDDECRLVSLGGIVEHACTFPDRKWRKGKGQVTFSCGTLIEYASNLMVWSVLRPTVQIGCDTFVAGDDGPGLPSQAMIDKLTPVGFYASLENTELLKDYVLLARDQGVTDEQSSIDSFKASMPPPEFANEGKEDDGF
ncbi:hypothetical protein DFH11DRAFT_1749043 [Phellopilus nigrolimitatus]|nr:hypothetical protein DFH11DRAFT_1749043 [Phellopilus nigrolimitatus]